MATNIEMNVKQESDYEVIYPQTICDMVINLLNPDTKELMGLEPTADADDAFRKVYLAQVLDGRALINFTVMGDDGTPCAGVQIESSQFCDSTGNKAPVIETNNEGKISIFVDNTSVQAKINYYGNLSDWSETYAVKFGQQYEKEITLTRYNFRRYTSSGQCKFSSDIERIGIMCVGAGGGPGIIASVPSLWVLSGGGGGYVSIEDDINIVSNNNYSIIVGSGTDIQSNGGNSSFMNVIGSGGEVGPKNYDEQGTGNGIGGWFRRNGSYISATTGTQKGWTGFATEDYYGGGGGGFILDEDQGINAKYPGAGHGLRTDAGQQRNGYGGGNGDCGCVAIRMYRQQDLT